MKTIKTIRIALFLITLFAVRSFATEINIKSEKTVLVDKFALGARVSTKHFFEYDTILPELQGLQYTQHAFKNPGDLTVNVWRRKKNLRVFLTQSQCFAVR